MHYIRLLGAIKNNKMTILENFTSKFLGYSTGVIFVFTLLITFNWYDSSDPTPKNITTIINLIGQIGLISWMYAIACKSHKILNKKGIELKLFKNFRISYLLMVVSFILLFVMDFVDPSTVATESDFERGEAFTYTRIVYGLAFILIICALSVWRGTAKLLVSAENGQEKSFGEYYKTFFLLIFSWIGVWFIHPRAKKL